MPSSFFLFVLLLLIFLPISLLCFLWCIVRPRPSKIEIRDRHVFISGGSSGIGLAIAHKAAQEGARVSILARDVAKLAQARASVEEATGVRVQTFSADVRNFEEIERVMKEAGPVDVLICNHGIFIPEELEVQSLETMRSMMDINVMGTIHLIKAALPLMKSSSRGSSSAAIAIMSSQAGQVVTDNGSAYKAAGRLIMSHFPQIYWTPCAAHCIDLLLEDFAKIPWIKKVIRRAKYITKFVYAHPHLHHLFCQCSKGKEIIRPSTTRFATNYILLDSLRDAKDALMNTFVSNSWKNDDRFASLRRTPEAHNSLAIIFDCVEKPGKFWFEVLNVIEVGVYGYSAYSSSKFALRGLAEVLQQELIEQNIHVSMIFPPDTNTPGLVEENKTKPEITKLLSSSSSSMEAADVAQKTIAGIKSGKFIISCNFEGFILSTITAGMSPQPSPVTAFVEVVATGFLRLVALCVVSSWYGIVHKEHTERKKMK